MPIYEYKCPKCGALEEHAQKISDYTLAFPYECSACYDEDGIEVTMNRIISKVNIAFKGTGFHCTDYPTKM